MSNGRAVIFDMDGVLVDSYLAHFESWRILGREHGIEITEQAFAATFGRTSRDMLKQLWPHPLSDEEIAPMDARKEAAYREIIRRDFPEMPGARELIRALHSAGFALAVGSSGPPENVQVTVDGLGLGECFRAVVTGMDVQRGKPDPQIFLLAAARLDVPAHRCAVVEDAPLGVEAARQAGMAALALTGTAERAVLARRAHHVVDGLGELAPTLVAELIDRHAARGPQS